MIFATVGTQLPFERLIRALDALAPSLDRRIVAQIGATAYEPVNIEWHRLIPAARMDEFFQQADIVVSHAGIGTILDVLKYGKPMVLVPRSAQLGEHRNDHQLATVAQLEGRQGLYVARTEEDLAECLRQRLPPPPSSTERVPERERLKSYLGEVIGKARRWGSDPTLEMTR